MSDSTEALNFSDYNGYKVVGTHTRTLDGNGLIDKTLKDVIFPEYYQGVKVKEVGNCAFVYTNIEYAFISRYIHTIMFGAFVN